MGEAPDAGAVDLDRLASAYDHRSVGAGDRERAITAARFARLGTGDVAVDVGGGRGAHAEVLATTGARVVVADLSPAMATHSAAAGVMAIVANGERLPLRDGIARLVYFHLSIHHGDPVRMVAEAARVTGPSGVVWVWTLDPSHHRSSFLARWFPSVADIDERRFPHPDVLAEAMTAHGLDVAPPRVRRDRVERTAADWEAAVRSGFVSTLHLISAEELEAGLARFHDEHPDPTGTIGYSLTYCAVAGTRP